MLAKISERNCILAPEPRARCRLHLSYEIKSTQYFLYQLPDKCWSFLGVPVHGGYSQWNSWSPCSLSGGTQQRSRSCTSPRPTNGGRDCNALGSATESRNCNNIQSCPGSTHFIFFVFIRVDVSFIMGLL